MKNEIILDVIPIFKNEMFPKKEEIWHFKNKTKNVDKDTIISYMLEEIKYKFKEYSVVIVLENGKVIEIIK